MYFPCLTANRSVILGTLNFLILTVSTFFKIVCKRVMFSSSLDNNNIPRIEFSILFIIIILIDNIPSSEDISPNNPGRLFWSSYSKYHSFLSLFYYFFLSFYLYYFYLYIFNIYI